MVNYDTVVEQEFYDDKTQKFIKVNLKIIDALYLRLLERIVEGLKR